MPTHPLWRPYVLTDDEELARVRLKPPAPAPVEVVAPNPRWPVVFDRVRDRIVAALGPTAIEIEHVGSTSVPGLWAKPVIDVDLVVPDSSDEAAYVPALEAAGFELRARQPEWEQHRYFRSTDPDANLHVFSPGSVESQRMRRFRDRLISDAADRTSYAALKRALAHQGFTDVMHYNNAKAALVYDIYERIFAADPEAAHDPQPRER